MLTLTNPKTIIMQHTFTHTHSRKVTCALHTYTVNQTRVRVPGNQDDSETYTGLPQAN